MPTPGDTVKGVVIDTTFTRGSPFGEQWWQIKEADGTTHSIAMCLNFNVPDRWPKSGDTVEVQIMAPRRCSMGGNSYIECAPWGNLIAITRKP